MLWLWGLNLPHLQIACIPTPFQEEVAEKPEVEEVYEAAPVEVEPDGMWQMGSGASESFFLLFQSLLRREIQLDSLRLKNARQEQKKKGKKKGKARRLCSSRNRHPRDDTDTAWHRRPYFRCMCTREGA